MERVKSENSVQQEPGINVCFYFARQKKHTKQVTVTNHINLYMAIDRVFSKYLKCL